MSFGVETFQKGPAVLLTERAHNLRLDGLQTVIAMIFRRLGEFIFLTRYPEQMREKGNKFDLQRATVSWTKMRDLRHFTTKSPTAE